MINTFFFSFSFTWLEINKRLHPFIRNNKICYTPGYIRIDYSLKKKKKKVQTVGYR
jgi:hypothetical protein